MDIRRCVKLVVLSGVRALGGFAVARWLTRRHLRILCYHGGSIGDERSYNPKLFCTPDHVRSRLDWLTRKSFSPMSLADAVAGVKQGRFAGKLPVVVTIDDGWFSSKEAIIDPCLGRGFPVTLYVATQVAERGIPVLDVTVSYILWRIGRRQVELAALPSLPAGRYDLADDETRRKVYDAVMGWLRQLPQRPAELSAGLDRFAAAIGLGVHALNLRSRRFNYFDADELLAIARQGCDIELHGHTHHYPIGRPDLLRADILACRDYLTTIGLPEPRHYCFPSGAFDELAAGVFAELGVVSGTTCLPGLIDPAAQVSLAYLPRFLDGGSVSRLEFEAEMSGFLHFVRACVRRRPRRLPPTKASPATF